MDYIAVITWIISLLQSNVALTTLVDSKVYRNLIPQGVSLPAVKINTIVTRPTRWSTGQRALTKAIIQVAACTQGDDLQQGAAIFQAIDAALDNQVCQVGTLAAKISQDMLVDTSQAVEGERFNLLGARYRIIYYQPQGAAGASFMPVLQAINTNTGPVSLPLAAATGNGQAYQFTNAGSGAVTLNCLGTDTVNGISTMTIAAYGSVTLASYISGTWSVTMSFFPTPVTGVNPIVTISGTVTLALPVQDTDYPVTLAANGVISLPQTTGSGVRLMFDLKSLGAYSLSMTLHGADVYEGGAALPPLVSGESLALRDIAAGTWAIE